MTIRFSPKLAALMLAVSMAAVPAVSFSQDTAPAAADASAPAAAMPADTSAVPVATPMPPAVSKEVVDNPYGLSALWAQGDFVSRGTLIFLAIMSIGSWYILITKLWESMKLAGQAKAANKGFFKAANLQEGAKLLKKGSAYRYIAETGIEAGERHEGTLTENVDRNDWVSMKVQRSIDDVNSRLQDGLAVLATVGSTAPFVGLFGTVWGIYHALLSISAGGGITIEKVAGPVGEALVMTAAGIAVAVPAVLAYNVFGKMAAASEAELEGFALDLREMVTGAATDALAPTQS